MFNSTVEQQVVDSGELLKFLPAHILQPKFERADVRHFWDLEEVVSQKNYLLQKVKTSQKISAVEVKKTNEFWKGLSGIGSVEKRNWVFSKGKRRNRSD